MKYTTNLNLKKPESTDFFNIEDFNDNTDALDAAYREINPVMIKFRVSNEYAGYYITSGNVVSLHIEINNDIFTECDTNKVKLTTGLVPYPISPNVYDCAWSGTCRKHEGASPPELFSRDEVFNVEKIEYIGEGKVEITIDATADQLNPMSNAIYIDITYLGYPLTGGLII